MKTKIYFLISIISFSFYQCVDEDETQFEPSNSLMLQKNDSISENDSTFYSITEDTDPPKDKDPYIKKH